MGGKHAQSVKLAADVAEVSEAQAAKAWKRK